MNKTKLLTKTMKIIEYERHVKGNKNGNSYEITNLKFKNVKTPVIQNTKS